MSVYFVTRFCRAYFEGTPDFFKYHFTDLLFIPTVATFALIFVRVFKRDNSITVSPWLIGFLVLTMTLYFEWYLPTFKSHVHPYTSDWNDVLMYVLGGVEFLWIQFKYFRN
jgi:hypothetical protein